MSNASTTLIPGARAGYVEVNGIKLHYEEAGEKGQPLMLLLHGIPLCTYTWRHQVQHFKSTFHVVALHQRGYYLSAKPPAMLDYKLDCFVADVVEAIRKLSPSPGACTLVGHDMGGMVAWEVAQRHSLLVARVVILNAYSLASVWRALTWVQALRMWYMLMFQPPRLGEWVLGRDDYSFHKGMLPPGECEEQHVRVYKQAWATQGSFTPTINFYRALPYSTASQQVARVPLLLMHGMRDEVMGVEIVAAGVRFAEDARMRVFQDAGHMLPIEKPQEVNAAIEEFIGDTVDKAKKVQ